MDSYIIKIQARDELPFIIDKIINTRAKRVYLLIPEESSVAQHVINLRLLKREADSLGKDVIVVSNSRRVQSLALKASLQVHQETEELKRGAERESYIEGASSKMRDIISPLQENFSAERAPEHKKGKEEVKKLKKEKKKPAESLEKRDIQAGGKKAEAGPPQIKIKTRFYEPEEGGRFKSKYPGSFIENFWNRRRKPKPQSVSAKPKPNIFSYFAKMKVSKYLILFFVAASFVASGLTFYSILPGAKIEITAFVEDVGLQIRIRADANIADVLEEKFVIPAQIFERTITKSKTVVTSGEQEINKRARGIIKVYNAFSSAPQTLVAATRFISEDGKLFRIEETIVVPGSEVEGGKIIPSYIEAEVVAAEPGSEFNIGPSSFSIPGFKGTAKYLAFYGKSENSMSGGRTGTARIVSKSDYEGAENQLKDELREAATKELKLSLQEGFVVPSGADSISDVALSSTKNVGEEAGEFKITGSLSLKAFVVRKADVINLLSRDFESRFDGKRLLLEGQEIDYRIQGIDFNRAILDLQASYSARASAKVSEEAIRNGVLGGEEREARSFLASYPGISEAKLTFWPFWVHNIPLDPSKTEIIIKP